MWTLMTQVCTSLLMGPTSKHRKPPGEMGVGMVEELQQLFRHLVTPTPDWAAQAQ